MAEALLPYGVEGATGRAGAFWEYYDVPDHPGLVRPGASGMAQGRIAQLVARAYHRTGDQRLSRTPPRAPSAMVPGLPVNRGGVVNVVSAPGGPSAPGSSSTPTRGQARGRARP